jgi:hypothetical protein
VEACATFDGLAVVGQLKAALGDYGVEAFDVGDVLVEDWFVDDLP